MSKYIDIYKEQLKMNKMILILGIPALVKFFTFYTLMDVNSNFPMVVLTSLVMTALLFSIFKRKWVGGVIYFLLSCLMFADVTYYSYFGKYLSFNMLGAAEVVGDIGECIAVVMRPINFVMILDAVIFLVYILIKRKKEVALERERYEGLFRFGGMIVLLAIIILCGNFSTFSKSIRNQEFYCFHVYDAIECAFGSTTGSLEAFEDSYKDEIDGPLFGVAKGRNVMFIQLESFMNFAINREYNGQELTPNLNALIKDNSIYCENFYQQVGSGNTSDAEFAANNSIYGTVLSYTYKVYGDHNYFRGLPVLLGEQGYNTAVFHAYEDRTFWSRETAYPNLGFDHYYGGLKQNGGDYEMTEWTGWGLTDSEFFGQTVELMEDNLTEPYYAFVNTLSNHHPFKMMDQYQFIDIDKDLEGTLVGNYLQSVAYVDYALGQYFDELKARNMYDDTIFVLYGDHAGITHNDENDETMKIVLGRDFTDDVLLNVPCIIHIPNPDREVTQVVSKACGQLDILPTLAYLMGWKDLDTVYFGHNMLSDGYGFVAEQTFVKRGSFIYGDIMYEMSLDGVFENGKAWQISSGKPVKLDGLYDYYLKGMDIINASEYVLKVDALRTLFLEGGTLTDENAEAKRTAYPDAVVDSGFPYKDLLGAGTAEALTKSYDSGYQYIRLTIRWDEDGEGCHSIDRRTGEIQMNQDEIVEWYMEHQGSHLIVDIDGERVKSLDNTLAFFGAMGEEGTQFGRSITLWEKATSDFTGRLDVFLDVSSDEMKSTDNATLLKFIDVNNVWAIVMTEADMKGERAELLDAACKVYIEYPDGRVEPKPIEK